MHIYIFVNAYFKAKTYGNGVFNWHAKLFVHGFTSIMPSNRTYVFQNMEEQKSNLSDCAPLKDCLIP